MPGPNRIDAFKNDYGGPSFLDVIGALLQFRFVTGGIGMKSRFLHPAAAILSVNPSQIQQRRKQQDVLLPCNCTAVSHSSQLRFDDPAILVKGQCNV